MSDLHSIPPSSSSSPTSSTSSTSSSLPPRRAILDLAPLELECLHALWSLAEEASVRDVRTFLQPTCPRAYTTIMTILDRLAHKALVTRRKSGRAWLYTPTLSAAEARSSALGKLVEHFFSGSTDSLLAHISSSPDVTSAPSVTAALAPRSLGAGGLASILPSKHKKQKESSAPASASISLSRLPDTLL